MLLMMVASITLLPALLGYAGRRIDQTSRAAAIAIGAFVLMALIGVFTGIPLLLALLAGIVIAIVVIPHILRETRQGGLHG